MSIEIRRMKAEDRHAVIDMLRRITAFKPFEVSVAMELIDEYLEDKTSDYFCISALKGTPPRLVGYACYGPTPLTQGTFDLYWIATDPNLSRSGVGERLLKSVEQEVKSAGARLLVIETDSNPQYQSAVRFYLKQGYSEEARLKDFYFSGNDKLIFVKRFASTSHSAG